MKKKGMILGTAAVLLAVTLTGCGSSGPSYVKNDSYSNGYSGGSGYSSNAYYDSAEGYYDEAEEYFADAGTGSGEIYTNSGSGNSNNLSDSRKLIRTVDLSVETMEYDTLYAFVKNKTAELGGYIESMRAYSGDSYGYYKYGGYVKERNVYMTLRIPKKEVDSFLTEVESNGNVLSHSENVTDVTLTYVDLESRKQVLEAERDRLMEFMAEAEYMEDIITIERRLSEVCADIESMESRLRTYDDQVDYSTITLYIEEVVELTPVEPEEISDWQRLGDGFVRSVENVLNGLKEFGIGFVIAIPYLLVIGLIIFGVVMLIIAIVKASAKKANKRRAQYMAGNPYARGAYPYVQPVMPDVPEANPAEAEDAAPSETDDTTK